MSEGKTQAPSGDYVFHVGLFYPISSKNAYPIKVVVDIAAKKTNKVVLVCHDGVLMFLSGTERVSLTEIGEIETDGDEKDKFYSSLRRLSLLSDSDEILALGNISIINDTPLTLIKLSDLRLPPVIKRKKTYFIIAIFIALLVFGFVLKGIVKAKINSKSTDIAETIKAADAEMSLLLKSVVEERTRIKNESKPDPLVSISAPIDALDMPPRLESFMAEFYENKKIATNSIRVTNGQFKY